MLTTLALGLALNADWPTFAHDDRRSGFQPNSAITRANVSALKLHWSVALAKFEPAGTIFTSSPVVVDGVVYICSRGGTVYALRERDGSLIWRRHVGNDIRMTPVVQDKRLFVGLYGVEVEGRLPKDGAFLAMDPATGKVLWRTALVGVIRSDPIITGGTIYEGTAGGDAETGALNGSIVAIDENTGHVRSDVWYTSSVGHSGGGIWSPLSFDGASLYFGTGNTTDGSGVEDSIVSITTGLKTRWNVRTKAPTGEDEDVGGGVMLMDGVAYCKGKSGVLYAIDMATGRTVFASTVHPDSPGGGGFGTPTGDGRQIVASSGDAAAGSPYSKLVAFDKTGKQLYDIGQREMASPSLQAAFVRGVGIAPLDRTLTAFDSMTGEILVSYPTASGFYSTPAITRSSVYDVDLAGNVYALALNAATVHSEKLVVTNRPLSGAAAVAPNHLRRWLAAAFAVIVAAALAGGMLVWRRRRAT